MSFRFRKRVGLLGGLVHVNLSKGGVSISAGVPGANINYDLSGRRKNVRATVTGERPVVPDRHRIIRAQTVAIVA